MIRFSGIDFIDNMCNIIILIVLFVLYTNILYTRTTAYTDSYLSYFDLAVTVKEALPVSVRDRIFWQILPRISKWY